MNERQNEVLSAQFIITVRNFATFYIIAEIFTAPTVLRAGMWIWFWQKRREIFKFLLKEFLIISKAVLFCFHTFGVRRSIDVLDLENQSGSGSGSLGFSLVLGISVVDCSGSDSLKIITGPDPVKITIRI